MTPNTSQAVTLVNLIGAWLKKIKNLPERP
jgi:hypothetical protein